MDWIITIPQTENWDKYIQELKCVEDGKGTLNYRTSYIPREMSPNDRMFITYRGIVRGWMRIVTAGYRPGFTCSVTMRYWAGGNYILRSGKFHEISTVIKFDSFRGVRRFNSKSHIPKKKKMELDTGNLTLKDPDKLGWIEGFKGPCIIYNLFSKGAFFVLAINSKNGLQLVSGIEHRFLQDVYQEARKLKKKVKLIAWDLEVWFLLVSTNDNQTGWKPMYDLIPEPIGQVELIS